MFFTDERSDSIPIHLVWEESLEEWLRLQSQTARNWLAANAFKAEKQKILLVPSTTGGLAEVVVGMGKRPARDEINCWHASGLPDRLPEGHYHLAQALPIAVIAQFAHGWAYGQY